MNQNPRAAQVPGRPSLALAWGGGVVFVGSLATFLFEYLVGYGSAAPAGPVGAAIAMDVALFSIFALHHSLLARPIVKRLVTALIPVWAERSLFTWVSSALLIWVCLTWHPVPGTLYTLSGLWRVAGYLLQGMGLLLTGAGARALDVLDLAGVRPGTGRPERRSSSARPTVRARRVPDRAAPALSRVGALRVRHAGHDWNPGGVCRRQYNVSGARNPARGARADRGVR